MYRIEPTKPPTNVAGVHNVSENPVCEEQWALSYKDIISQSHQTSEQTFSAASRMNCFEASFQIAGTVRTHLISCGWRSGIASLQLFSRCSFRYLIQAENTSIAGSFLPLMSSSKNRLFRV